MCPIRIVFRMPRQSRIDTTGALHHIIARGIERRKIVEDDQDRYDFLKNLGLILEQTETACFAWSLMSNHFHLLLRTRVVPNTGNLSPEE